MTGRRQHEKNNDSEGAGVCRNASDRRTGAGAGDSADDDVLSQPAEPGSWPTTILTRRRWSLPTRSSKPPTCTTSPNPVGSSRYLLCHRGG
ncbi:hypothetical protein LNQ03_25045 [Klebsiella pneumoniae subsp. pneumoniae]|nr:hypothetical protein [Klebsiella pneumoniae subsp. pneumoniae]